MLYNSVEHRRDTMQLARQIPIMAKSSWHVKEELTKACEGLLAKGFPYLTAYRYERSRHQNRENIVFQRHQRTDTEVLSLSLSDKTMQLDILEPAGLEGARQDLLVEDILSLTGDTKSKQFYRLTANKLSEETIRRAISETRAAHFQHGIRTTPGRYFIDVLKRFATDQGISLFGPSRQESTEKEAAEQGDLFSLKTRVDGEAKK